MKIQKPDRLVGYALLVIGLVILFIPVLISILIVLGYMQIPVFVQKPTVNPSDPNAEIARMMAETFPLLNVIPTFLLFVVLVYAGSVLMGKGVGLIKEVSWKVTQVTKEEAEEMAKKEAEEEPATAEEVEEEKPKPKKKP